MQRRIRQLKTNYRCCAFNLSPLATFAFNLSLSNSFSSSFDSSSFFDLSSSSDSSSSNLFVFVLSIKDLSTRDLSINQQINLNNLLINDNCNCNRSIVFFSQIFVLLYCTI